MTVRNHIKIPETYTKKFFDENYVILAHRLTKKLGENKQFVKGLNVNKKEDFIRKQFGPVGELVTLTTFQKEVSIGFSPLILCVNINGSYEMEKKFWEQ